MVEKKSTLLSFLHISHYILLFVYFSLYFGFKLLKDTEKEEKYVRILNTVYTLGVGIVLICMRFPNMFVDFSSIEYSKQLKPLLFSAGVIVLTSVSYDDMVLLWKTITFSSTN